MDMTKKNCVRRLVGENDIADAYTPEWWAENILMVLTDYLLLGRLVTRDYENQLANAGDVVNCRRPVAVDPSRHRKGQDVVRKDQTAVNVPVVLNQHFVTQVYFDAADVAKGLESMMETMIRPTGQQLAAFMERAIAGQVSRISSISGGLNTITGANAESFLLDSREIMDLANVPDVSRRLALSASAEKAMLAAKLFVSAEQVGDTGEALRDGRLGKKYGIDTYKTNVVASIRPDASKDTTVAGAVNLPAGYPVGTTTMLTDGAAWLTASVPVGAYFVVAGDDLPHRITAKTADSSGNVDDITFDPPLYKAVLNDAVITLYTPCTVAAAEDTVGNPPSNIYPAGWEPNVWVDGFTSSRAPRKHQLISFATGGSTHSYTIIGVEEIASTSARLLLDRPLEAAVADNAVVYLWPAGSYNLLFVPEAIAVVCRPLSQPKALVKSAVIEFGGYAVRITITWDDKKLQEVVTVDCLFGVTVLNQELATVMAT